MVEYCDDCGAPIDPATGGRFEFFYANKRAGSPRWSEPRFVCGTHKGARVQAGHSARVPGPAPADNPADDET